MNTLVILLVLVDLTNIVISLVSPEPDPLAEHPVQRWLSFAVISCFVLEMALRMLAMGRRFFRSWYNIFDVVVVSVSVAARAPAPALSPPLPTVAPTRVATVHSRPPHKQPLPTSERKDARENRREQSHTPVTPRRPAGRGRGSAG